MTTITSHEPASPEAPSHVVPTLETAFLLAVAASYLGMSEELIEQGIRDGWSLADAAYATGKDLGPLEAAMCEAAEARVTEALETGRVTAAQAGILRTESAAFIVEAVGE